MMETDLTEFNGWTTALSLVPERLDAEMLESHRIVMGETINEAKQNAPYADGPLRADIRILVDAHKGAGGYEGKVGTDLVYSAQREFGGTIYPRNGKYLVFTWDRARSKSNPEGLVFARSVTQEGSFYMRDAANTIEGQAAQYYELGIERTLEGAF